MRRNLNFILNDLWEIADIARVAGNKKRYLEIVDGINGMLRVDTFIGLTHNEYRGRRA